MSRINFIAERRAPEGVGETADWNRPVDAAPIVELFADWRFDWLDVPGVIAAADEILEYPMVDREPLPRWTFGRHHPDRRRRPCALPERIERRLAGDHRRAHPRVRAGDPADGRRRLAAYEAERRPATARLHEMTRRSVPSASCSWPTIERPTDSTTSTT